MTTEMTPEQFLRWRAYSIIEPFADIRSDLQTAYVIKTLWDVNRDVESRRRQPLSLDDFRLEYGGNFGKPAPDAQVENTQTVGQRTNALLQMAMGFANKGEARTKLEEIRRQLAERHART